MWVAFHCAKIVGIFGQLQEINGTLRPKWKFSGQSGPSPEMVLFDRSVRWTETCRSMISKNSRLQSHFAKQ